MLKESDEKTRKSLSFIYIWNVV